MVKRAERWEKEKILRNILSDSVSVLLTEVHFSRLMFVTSMENSQIRLTRNT